MLNNVMSRFHNHLADIIAVADISSLDNVAIAFCECDSIQPRRLQRRFESQKIG